MLILPLNMEGEYYRPGLVSWTIGSVTLYQALLAPLFPGLRMNGPELASLWLTEPWLLPMAFVRGCGPVSALFLALFWILFGSSLEYRIGSLGLFACWLIGCLLPLPLAHTGLVAFESAYWLGLGGAVFCLGVTYYTHALRDVKTFYFVCAPPWRFGGGTTTLPGVLVLLFMHIALCFAQLVHYPRYSPGPPPGMGTAKWLFVYAWLPLVVCLASRWMLSSIGKTRPATD
jgi:hypothetical protein